MKYNIKLVLLKISGRVLSRCNFHPFPESYFTSLDYQFDESALIFLQERLKSRLNSQNTFKLMRYAHEEILKS